MQAEETYTQTLYCMRDGSAGHEGPYRTTMIAGRSLRQLFDNLQVVYGPCIGSVGVETERGIVRVGWRFSRDRGRSSWQDVTFSLRVNDRFVWYDLDKRAAVTCAADNFALVTA